MQRRERMRVASEDTRVINAVRIRTRPSQLLSALVEASDARMFQTPE
jgi:hypothetical protein